jgi:hypothetical protein
MPLPQFFKGRALDVRRDDSIAIHQEAVHEYRTHSAGGTGNYDDAIGFHRMSPLQYTLPAFGRLRR